MDPIQPLESPSPQAHRAWAAGGTEAEVQQGGEVREGRPRQWEPGVGPGPGVTADSQFWGCSCHLGQGAVGAVSGGHWLLCVLSVGVAGGGRLGMEVGVRLSDHRKTPGWGHRPPLPPPGTLNQVIQDPPP